MIFIKHDTVVCFFTRVLFALVDNILDPIFIISFVVIHGEKVNSIENLSHT